MTAGGPSAGQRSRSRQTIAYTAITAIAGVSALVILGFLVVQGEPTVVDGLLWGALAVLLLGSAVHQWWFAGRAADRSQHIVEEFTDSQVDSIAANSDGDIDTVRRLREARPGLSLRDAYELMQAHKRRHAPHDT